MSDSAPVDWSKQWLLGSCSEATRARLVSQSHVRDIAPFELVIKGGTPTDYVWILAEGIVRVHHRGEDGTEFTVKLLRAPDAVGQVEVIAGQPWMASVQALTPLKALAIPKDLFLKALDDDHQFCRAVLEDVNAKFLGTIEASRAIGLEGCNARLARVLLEYVDQFGREKDGRIVIRHPLTRERLAAEIGAARRSVDRALQLFTREGILGQEKGWLVVENIEKLKEALKAEG